MKVFFSDNTLKRLMKMVEDLKSGTVSIRKYNVKEDPISNAITIKGKVNDKYRDSHLSGKFYNYYVPCDGVISKLWGDFETMG
jgi:hypothetical protein